MGHAPGDYATSTLIRIDTARIFVAVREVFERMHSPDADAVVHLSWDWLHGLFRGTPGRGRVSAFSRTDRIGDARDFLPLRRDLH